MDIYIYFALIGIAAGLVKGISAFGSSLVTIPLLVMVLGVERIDEIIVMMITFNVVLNFLLVKENNALKIENLKDYQIIVIFGAVFTVLNICSGDSNNHFPLNTSSIFLAKSFSICSK